MGKLISTILAVGLAGAISTPFAKAYDCFENFCVNALTSQASVSTGNLCNGDPGGYRGLQAEYVPDHPSGNPAWLVQIQCLPAPAYETDWMIYDITTQTPDQLTMSGDSMELVANGSSEMLDIWISADSYDIDGDSIGVDLIDRFRLLHTPGEVDSDGGDRPDVPGMVVVDDWFGVFNAEDYLLGSNLVVEQYLRGPALLEDSIFCEEPELDSNLLAYCPDDHIFSDGFETGELGAWSIVSGNGDQ